MMHDWRTKAPDGFSFFTFWKCGRCGIDMGVFGDGKPNPEQQFWVGRCVTAFGCNQLVVMKV